MPSLKTDTLALSGIYMKNALTILLLILLSVLKAHAQIAEEPDISWETFLQEYLANRTDDDKTVEETFLEQEMLERLEQLALHPLQINRAEPAELLEMPFLNREMVDSILSYRQAKHGFLSLGELQFIRGIDYRIRRYLSLFLRCDSAMLKQFSSRYPTEELTPGQKFYKGKHKIETRLALPFYRRKGYHTPDKPTAGNHYVGNSLYHNLRYRYQYKQEVCYGLSFEKDPGEPIAKQGYYPYDYISGYLVWRPKRKKYSFIAGDYHIISGHGLLFGQQFYGNNSLQINEVKRPVTQFKPHTGMDESHYFRGFATQMRSKGWEGMLFFSYRKKDARWDDEHKTVLSLQETGLHRTFNEIYRRRTLGTTTMGIHAGYDCRQFGLGMNAYFNHYAHTVNPPLHNYNRYYFRGKNASGASMTYFLNFVKWKASGETAIDESLHWATLHSVSYKPVSNWRLHLQARWLTPRFISIYGQAEQQASRVANEQGIKLSSLWQPTSNWQISGYVDLFRFPKPTYQAALSGSNGMEVSFRSAMSLPHNLSLTADYRIKTKQYTVSGHELLEYRIKQKLRVGLGRKKKKGEWLIQADGTIATRQTGQKSTGWMLSSRGSYVLTPTLRFRAFGAAFLTDDYDAAIYAYEPQLLHTFSYTTFAWHGIREAFLIDWNIGKKCLLSVKISSLHYFNKRQISSGTEAIHSSWKNDLSLQFRTEL